MPGDIVTIWLGCGLVFALAANGSVLRAGKPCLPLTELLFIVGLWPVAVLYLAIRGMIPIQTPRKKGGE